MFDIGIGEIILIAVVGLLVFGPDLLPRAAADAASWLRDMLAMASSARKDLADSAGLDLGDTMDTVLSLQELHPRNIASSFLDAASDKPEPTNPATNQASAKPAVDRPAFDPDAT